MNGKCSATADESSWHAVDPVYWVALLVITVIVIISNNSSNNNSSSNNSNCNTNSNNSNSKSTMVIGWHYLSKTTGLLRPDVLSTSSLVRYS